MLQDLERHFNKAVQDVFATMLRCELQPSSAEGWHMNGQPHVASCVGFFGKLNGVVYLYASEAFARHLASRLLDMAEAQIDSDEMLHDAMGEITNMVVGPVKSRFADNGMPCVLTIPSIVRGTNFSIEPASSTERRMFGYRCAEGELVAEVLIKNGTPQTT